MGVDAEDVNGDGRPDLFVTNYWNEPNSLYMNLGEGMFEDRTPTSGMATDSTPWVGWGCALADFDNDGWPDCFVTNGHVDNNLELLGYNSPYAQPPLLHRNLEGRGFRLATRDAGPYFDADSRRARGRLRRPGRRRRRRHRRQSQGRRTRPCSATTLRRTITGSASRWSARSATATPSVRASRSSWAAVRSFDNEKAARAWNPRTIPGS